MPRDDPSHRLVARPAEPRPGYRFEFRVTVFDEPRGPWWPTRDAARKSAIRLELASWDAERREYFLAVPVSIERREVSDAS